MRTVPVCEFTFLTSRCTSCRQYCACIRRNIDAETTYWCCPVCSAVGARTIGLLALYLSCLVIPLISNQSLTPHVSHTLWMLDFRHGSWYCLHLITPESSFKYSDEFSQREVLIWKWIQNGNSGFCSSRFADNFRISCHRYRISLWLP